MKLELDISNSNDKITESDYKDIIYGLTSPYETFEERDSVLYYIHDTDNLSNNEIVEFKNYKEVFEDKDFNSRFKQDLNMLSSDEIEKWIPIPVLNQLSNNDKEIDNILKNQRNREVDLDNDGIVDRIDIDDTRNAVQDVKDQSIVDNLTSKESARSIKEMKR